MKQTKSYAFIKFLMFYLTIKLTDDLHTIFVFAFLSHFMQYNNAHVTIARYRSVENLVVHVSCEIR